MCSLTRHKQEMERRIAVFDGECDAAISNIMLLKTQARSYLDKLPHEPSELKTRFLSCTRQLDELMYHLTEFNLTLDSLEKNVISGEVFDACKDPVFSPSSLSSQTSQTNQKLQTEPLTTHTLKLDEKSFREQAQINQVPKSDQKSWRDQAQLNQTPKTEQKSWREEPWIKKAPIQKSWRDKPQEIQANNEKSSRDQSPNQTSFKHLLTNGNAQKSQTSQTQKTQTQKELIVFSSASCSNESVSQTKEMDEKSENEGADFEVGSSLPPQPRLDPAAVFKATVISVDGANMWLVTDQNNIVDYIEEITEFYKNHQDKFKGDIGEFSYCAYYDEVTELFFRALYLRTQEPGVAEVYLVDTGECRRASAAHLLRLSQRFCAAPPMARCCHLAEVDLPDDDELQERQTTFLKQHLLQQFTIKLGMYDEDEDSESLGVYVYLDDGTTLNARLMEKLASIPEKRLSTRPDDLDAPAEPQEPPRPVKLETSNDELDIELDCEGPEYENPLEAVTGYNNRDEVDICKHYKGGAERTCFKGSRCKKRHVVIHPDGWTLDRVAVAGAVRARALPAPGAALRAAVAHVRSPRRLHAHLRHDEDSTALNDLIEEMTAAAATAKPLQLEPAVGELVSARYSDGRCYRARVTSCAGAHSTEVMYIDYGNTAEVAHSDITSLEPRWLRLPAQAVPCRLAGVSNLPEDETITNRLVELALDKTLRGRVIARDYDELTIELFDLEGFNIAEQLCILASVPLEPYQVEDDSRRQCLHIPA